MFSLYPTPAYPQQITRGKERLDDFKADVIINGLKYVLLAGVVVGVGYGGYKLYKEYSESKAAAEINEEGSASNIADKINNMIGSGASAYWSNTDEEALLNEFKVMPSKEFHKKVIQSFKDLGFGNLEERLKLALSNDEMTLYRKIISNLPSKSSGGSSGSGASTGSGKGTNSNVDIEYIADLRADLKQLDESMFLIPPTKIYDFIAKIKNRENYFALSQRFGKDVGKTILDWQSSFGIRKQIAEKFTAIGMRVDVDSRTLSGGLSSNKSLYL